MYRKEEYSVCGFVKKPEERDHMEDLGVDGIIIIIIK